MTQPRAWLDVTAVVIDALNHDWGGTVLPAVPHPRPDEFVVVRRTGGGHDGVLDRARVDVEIWSGQQGDSLVGVWSLTATIREYLRMMPTTTIGVSRVDESGVALLTDNESGAPRVLLSAIVWLVPTDPS